MPLSEKGREVLRENGRRTSAERKKAGFYSSEAQSRRRKAQLASEEAEADKMRVEGYEVYSPTVVCDRIAVKNGKVYFVDFKKPGQELRPGQQKIHDLVPEMYQIRYHEKQKR